jgi:hypothetical protein
VNLVLNRKADELVCRNEVGDLARKREGAEKEGELVKSLKIRISLHDQAFR